jgi:D-psicose/D-tagatose/L-ribulose 3-epimerase
MTRSFSTLSISEWIFGGRPFEEVARVALAVGCDAIEIAGEPDRPDRSRLPELLGGLAASGTTAMGRWPTDERDLAHPDRDARRRAVAYYQRCADLAGEIGAPVVGLVPTGAGRLDALSTYRDEWRFAVEGVREVALHAAERGVRVGIEATNRYETFLVNRVDQALALADDTGVAEVGVIADLFHMQLEETDPAAAVAAAGPRLLALHLADSTRLGLGHGTLRPAPIVDSARAHGFAGPLVLEFTAPGPNPFQADKGAKAMASLDVFVAESAAAARRLERDRPAR